MDSKTLLATPKAFSFLDSTAFPGLVSNQADNHLKCLNITPINFDRTNPNRITLHELKDEPKEAPMRSNQPREDTSNFNIDTLTLTSSDIDSLADRVQSLLRKSAKFNLFDDLSPVQKNISVKEELTNKLSPIDESSLNLLHNVTSPNKQTDFTLSSFPSSSDISLPKLDDKNNTLSGSNADYSNSPISFTSIFGTSILNDKETHTREVVHRSPPIKHDELCISKAINSNSIENKSRSLSTNPERIMLEADKILLRIQTLMNKAKPSGHPGSVSSSKGTLTSPTSDTIKPFSPVTHEQASKSSPIPILIHQQELNLSDDSDQATEYYQPPTEHNLSSFNQTFNSHIYNAKPNHNKLIRSNQQESITPSSSDHSSHSTASNHSFVPNRTILEEEENCLGQMQRDTSDLRRLHKDLMQFERDYKKQQERRQSKKLSTLPPNSKCSKTELNRAASQTHSTTKSARESHTRTVNNERPQTHSRPLPGGFERKSSSPSSAPLKITCRNSAKLQNEPQTNLHSNPRHVRFDHQHIAHEIDQIKADCVLVKPRLNNTADNNEPCECCLRHIKMNRRDSHKHLDCIQMDKMRLEDELPRRPKTAKGRIADDDSHFNKSVQTSIIMNNNDDHMKQSQIRPKSFSNGGYTLDCGFRGDPPGTIPRTPPPNNNNALSMRPLGYFVALNGNEPKKKPNNIRPSKSQQPENDQLKKTRPTSTIMPVAAHTLQDAFDRNMNQFKLRSLMRIRKIKDNEELRVQTADQRKEEITQTYLMTKKIESDRRQTVEKPVSDNHLTTNTKCKQTKKKPSSNQESFARPLPLMTRRVFTHREMRAQTEKVYRKLPEVKAQSVSVKREDDARRRRLMADIFKQRLKENAIRGKLNWPITSQAITS